jgi:hypothetical protein
MNDEETGAPGDDPFDLEPSAEDLRLAADEAKWIGEVAGTPLQELSAGALRGLAAKYMDGEIGEAYVYKYYHTCGHPGETMRALFRLRVLAVVMGDEAFDTLLAEKRIEWIQSCAEADAARRALAPCVTCGRSRDLLDDCPEGQGMCGECRWEREQPSYVWCEPPECKPAWLTRRVMPTQPCPVGRVL